MRNICPACSEGLVERKDSLLVLSCRVTYSAAPGTWRSPRIQQLFPVGGCDCQDSLWDSSGGNLKRERGSSSIFHNAVPYPDQAGVKCLSRRTAQAGKYEKWQMCRARKNHFYLLPFQTCPSMSLLQGRERADNFPCLENGASHSSN